MAAILNFKYGVCLSEVGNRKVEKSGTGGKIRKFPEDPIAGFRTRTGRSRITIQNGRQTTQNTSDKGRLIFYSYLFLKADLLTLFVQNPIKLAQDKNKFGFQFCQARSRLGTGKVPGSEVGVL